jgi:hypothetical protein
MKRARFVGGGPLDGTTMDVTEDQVASQVFDTPVTNSTDPEAMARYVFTGEDDGEVVFEFEAVEAPPQPPPSG